MQDVNSEGKIESQIYYANNDISVTVLADIASSQTVDITWRYVLIITFMLYIWYSPLGNSYWVNIYEDSNSKYS